MLSIFNVCCIAGWVDILLWFAWGTISGKISRHTTTVVWISNTLLYKIFHRNSRPLFHHNASKRSNAKEIKHEVKAFLFRELSVLIKEPVAVKLRIEKIQPERLDSPRGSQLAQWTWLEVMLLYKNSEGLGICGLMFGHELHNRDGIIHGVAFHLLV